jgi:hypothetical protein
MADRISHGQDRQAEGQRNAKQADTELRKTSRDHRTAAAREGKPKGPNRFSGAFAYLVPIHVLTLFRASAGQSFI